MISLEEARRLYNLDEEKKAEKVDVDDGSVELYGGDLPEVNAADYLLEGYHVSES